MTNFIYCYLVPFIAGVLVFVAFGFAIVCIIKICEAVSDWYYMNLSGLGHTRRIIGKMAEVLKAVFAWAFVIFVALVFIFVAWNIGLDILNRLSCR